MIHILNEDVDTLSPAPKGIPTDQKMGEVNQVIKNPCNPLIRLIRDSDNSDNNFKRTCDPCEFTSPQYEPRKTIDFIAYTPSKKFRLIEHQVIAERYASDHLPVIAILEVIN